MGTISNLIDRLQRKSELRPISVSSFGFTVGETFCAWQSISEIWGYKVDRITTDEAFLEFCSGGHSIAVSEEHTGFDALEVAMAAVFPPAASWRQTVLDPPFARSRTLLYRRA